MLRKTILLVFILLLASMVSLFAEEILMEDDYIFVIKDGMIEVRYYEGSASKLNIPASIEHQGRNYPVTSIGKMAFYNSRNLQTITIPGSITSIGTMAFYKCPSLTTVTIPDSVTEVGEGAFLWCVSLTSVTIPSSVTSIGKGAFVESAKVKLSVSQGSYAHKYAQKNDIPYSLH